MSFLAPSINKSKPKLQPEIEKQNMQASTINLVTLLHSVHGGATWIADNVPVGHPCRVHALAAQVAANAAKQRVDTFSHGSSEEVLRCVLDATMDFAHEQLELAVDRLKSASLESLPQRDRSQGWTSEELIVFLSVRKVINKSFKLASYVFDRTAQPNPAKVLIEAANYMFLLYRNELNKTAKSDLQAALKQLVAGIEENSAWMLNQIEENEKASAAANTQEMPAVN